MQNFKFSSLDKGNLVTSKTPVADIRLARKTGDATVYTVTVFCDVVLNLLEGVLIGLALPLILVVRRVLWARVYAEQIPGSDDWRVVVEGSLSFLSLPRLSRALQWVPPAK